MISCGIKGGWLAFQFYTLVIIVFLAICFIYAINRTKKLLAKKGGKVRLPLFRDTAVIMAVSLWEMSPANRDNIRIYIN